jgi:hypothetical protein
VRVSRAAASRSDPQLFPSAITIPQSESDARRARRSQSSLRAPRRGDREKRGADRRARKTMAAGLDLRRVIRARQRSSRAVMFADAPTAASCSASRRCLLPVICPATSSTNSAAPVGMRNGWQGHNDDFGGDGNTARDRVAETDGHARPKPSASSDYTRQCSSGRIGSTPAGGNSWKLSV